MIGSSQNSGKRCMPFPKVVKRIRTKRDADRAVDKSESAKVRERSEGRCEIRCRSEGGRFTFRCTHYATQVHHMIGGNGKRGRGISALAEHKQHVCNSCHDDITGRVGGKKLQRLGGLVPLWTDCYERIR